MTKPLPPAIEVGAGILAVAFVGILLLAVGEERDAYGEFPPPTLLTLGLLLFLPPLAHLASTRLAWPTAALLAITAIGWSFIGTREAGTESMILLYAASCMLARAIQHPIIAVAVLLVPILLITVTTQTPPWNDGPSAWNHFAFEGPLTAGLPAAGYALTAASVRWIPFPRWWALPLTLVLLVSSAVILERYFGPLRWTGYLCLLLSGLPFGFSTRRFQAALVLAGAIFLYFLPAFLYPIGEGGVIVLVTFAMVASVPALSSLAGTALARPWKQEGRKSKQS